MQNCHPTVKTVASKTPILWELAFGLANKIQLAAPTSHIRVPDFKSQLSFQFQLLANPCWEAADDGTNTWTPTIPVGDMD